MHDSGLQHVSLTPGEIRIGPDNQVTIQTQRSAPAMGTIVFRHAKYVAPETLRSDANKPNCIQMDSYVLGFIFYELLLGRELFRKTFGNEETGSPAAWLLWHASERSSAPALAELLEGFPQAISNVVSGMIEKDPAKRIFDLAHVSFTFRNMVARTIVAPRTVNPSSAPTPKKSRLASLPDFGKFLIERVKAFVSRLPLDIDSSLKPVKRFWTRYEREIQWAVSALAVALLVSIAVFAIRDTPAQATNDLGAMPKTIETDSGLMVLVKGGTFPFPGHQPDGSGSPGTAYISPFYMDYREVTNDDLRRFCAATGRACSTTPVPVDQQVNTHRPAGPADPALNVSLDIARAFTERAGKHIPSQVEWRAAMKESASPVIFNVRSLLSPGERAFEWIDSDLWSPAHNRNSVRTLIETDTGDAVLAPTVVSEVTSLSRVTFRGAAGPEILTSKHILKGWRIGQQQIR